MNEGSEGTHLFRLAVVPSDGTCFFWSMLLLFKLNLLTILNKYLTNDESNAIMDDDLLNLPLADYADDETFESEGMQLLNETIRAQVADDVLAHEDIHDLVISSTDSGYSVEEYCHRIREAELWAGAPEFMVLSDSLNTLIVVISLTQEPGKPFVYTSFYGEVNPHAKQCVFILYDKAEGHYSPLYLASAENPRHEQTIFDRNDPRIMPLVAKFIKDTLQYGGEVKLDTISYADIDRSICTAASSMKRQSPSIDDTVPRINQSQFMRTEASPEYYNPMKRLKTSMASTTTFPDNRGESVMIGQRIQDERVASESMVTEQQTGDLPTDSRSLNQEDKSDMKLPDAGERENDGLPKLTEAQSTAQ